MPLGKRMSFDQLPADVKEMELSSLKRRMHDRLEVDRFDKNTLRTLGFMDSDGRLVNVAALLSDVSPFPGIGVIRYGGDRLRSSNGCAWTKDRYSNQLDKAVGIAERAYVFEKMTSTTRERVERLPLDAFRELNGKPTLLVDLDASIRVTLPVFGARPATTLEERAILDALPAGMLMARKQVADACGMSLSTTGRLLASLERKGLVERSGAGRGARHSRRT